MLGHRHSSRKHALTQGAASALGTAATLALGLGLGVPAAGAAPAAAPAAADAPRTVSMTGTRAQGLPGQYQVAVSPRTGRMFVTSVLFPEKTATGMSTPAATIAELDPHTLAPVRAAVLPTAPLPTGALGPGLDTSGFTTPRAGFGLTVDDARGVLWTTDTINDTVSAYDLTTMEHVWTSPAGVVKHGHSLRLDDHGDVLVSGQGGVYKITGPRTAPALAPFALTGAGESMYPVELAVDGDTTYVSDAALAKISVVDTHTGALQRTIGLTPESSAKGVFHSGIGVDPALGVLVHADQGAFAEGEGAPVGGGVAFYRTDGTPLARLAGGQDLAVHVDRAEHIAYVTDFSGGTVRAFDLRAAAAGRAEVIGVAHVGASTAPMSGVNQLVPVPGGRLLAVAKDKAYAGVTIPYGADLATGKPVATKADADSLTYLTPVVRSGAFDPAKDATTCTQAPGHDLAALPYRNGPFAVPGTGSLDGGSLDALTGSLGEATGSLGS